MLRAKAKRLGRKPKNPPCREHINNRARRKMVKQFIADLWVKWRKLEGLPVSEPYAVAILGHQKNEKQKKEKKRHTKNESKSRRRKGKNS